MSPRRKIASKQNSYASTGPRSASGKASVSRNAVKHGLSGAPVLTTLEKKRWNEIRTVLNELTDEPESAIQDIDDCAITQVLIERTMSLRYQAQCSEGRAIEQLEKLVRFENRLNKYRNRLLAILDVNEYEGIDSLNADGIFK